MYDFYKRYMKTKAKNKNALVFYRLGDFYEMLGADAETASKELDLTLTSRDCGQEERVPMCGVPYHCLDKYVQALIIKGYNVAICEDI